MNQRALGLPALGVVALVVAMAGCGSKAPVASAPRITVPERTLRTLPPDGFTTTTTPVTPPPEATAPAGTGPGSATAPVTAARTSPFCSSARRYTETAASLSSATPATLPQVLTNLTAAIEQAAAVAPPSIKSDTTVVANTHRQFLNALQQANFDAAQVPPAVAASLKSEPFVGARDRLRAFSQQSCA